MVIELTTSNFESITKETDKLIVIDFWAEWCGPCRMVAPIIHELSEEYADKVIFGKVDVDSENELAMKFAIRNIPTIIFMKNNKTIDKIVGALPKSKFIEKINSLM